MGLTTPHCLGELRIGEDGSSLLEDGDNVRAAMTRYEGHLAVPENSKGHSFLRILREAAQHEGTEGL